MRTWINRDPIREMGGLNMYAAFGNSPTNYADAYGQFPFIAMAIGAGMGAAFGGIGNTVAQLYKKGWRFDCLDGREILVAIGAGAVAGGLMPIGGTSVVGAVGLNGLVGIGQYLGNNWVHGNESTGAGIASNGILSGLAGGLLGGAWTPIRGVNSSARGAVDGVEKIIQVFKPAWNGSPVARGAARFLDKAFDVTDEIAVNSSRGNLGRALVGATVANSG